MSSNSIVDDVEKKTFLNIFVFSSNFSIVKSLNLKMSILSISFDWWFLFFVYLTNRHKLVSVSTIFSIFGRKLTRFVFWMIFCLRSLIFMYSVKSCKFYDTNHKWRSLRVFLIITLHFSFQNDLTCRLKIVHDTIISTINYRNFCISFTQMLISRIVIENCNVNACFITFFNFV
jgi:hypothetical protein